MKRIEISNKKNPRWFHRWLLEHHYIKEWKRSDLPWDCDEAYKKEGKVSLCRYVNEVAISVLAIGLPKIWKKIKIPLFITFIIFAVWCQSVILYYYFTDTFLSQDKIFIWTSVLIGAILVVAEAFFVAYLAIKIIGALLLCVLDEITFWLKGTKIKRPDKNAGILRIFWEWIKIKWGMVKLCPYIYIVD